MAKLKRDDEVVVIAGRDKGKRGKIEIVLPNDKLVIAGVNIVKKHQKPNPQMQIPGGIIEKPAPIAKSNVAIWNAAENKADRVGYKVLDDGTKVRVFKSTGEVVDV